MIVNKKAFDREAKIREEMVNFERQRILKILSESVVVEKLTPHEVTELRKRILNDASAKPYASEQHIGSELCPQTVQRSTEGLPDGCAEKPEYVIESTEGEMTPKELDEKLKKITEMIKNEHNNNICISSHVNSTYI